MCVYSCSPGTLVEVVLIERMTLLNESKESKGQDLFMLELLKREGLMQLQVKGIKKDGAFDLSE